MRFLPTPSDTPQPVSYTHLDVYKRQLLSKERYTEALTATERALALDPNHLQATVNQMAALNSLQRFTEAVSYTHLGQRTSIVSSPTGYEILLLTDARPALLAEYAAVKTKVGVRWQTEQQQQARDRYIRALAEQFGVTVLEKGLENANPTKQK